MNNLDKQYLDLINDIIKTGVLKENRTSTPTLSTFGKVIRHNMRDGFPILTTKKVYFNGVLVELLFFLKGLTNIKYMIDNNCNIWVGDAYKRYVDITSNTTLNMQSEPILSKKEFLEELKTNQDFVKKHGELGPIYGKQWRSWSNTKQIDQLVLVIEKLKTNPNDRRLIVNSWNVADLPNMILPPCHYTFQLYTKPAEADSNGKLKLSLLFNMRSTDVPLGLPFNLASYGLLLEIIAKHVDMVADELIAVLGDAHIYVNQLEGLKTQLDNKSYKLPTIEITKTVDDLAQYEVDDFILHNYVSNDTIKMPLSN